MVIMYNADYGLADAKSCRLRCVRTRVDSVCRASKAVCQQAVAVNPVGQGRGRWADAGGEEQEEARPENAEGIDWAFVIGKLQQWTISAEWHLLINHRYHCEFAY